MGGKQNKIDQQHPDLQKVNLEQSGRETLNTVLGVVFESQQKLKSVSSNYLEGNGGTIPGVQNAVNTLKDGTHWLEKDHSSTADEIRKSTSQVEGITGPIFEKLKQLSGVKTVNGPVDELNAQVTGLFEQMLMAGDTAEGLVLARTIERQLMEKVNEMQQDAGNTGAESAKVERGLDEERERFVTWSRGEGYSNDYRTTLSAHNVSLEMVRDSARTRGAELQGTCKFVGGNLEGVAGAWTSFVEKNFVK